MKFYTKFGADPYGIFLIFFWNYFPAIGNLTFMALFFKNFRKIGTNPPRASDSAYGIYH